MEIRPVTSGAEINQVAALAAEIWSEYWPSIIGDEQTQYMVEKFQSVDAITQQISDGYRYFLAGIEGSWDGYCAVLPTAGKMMISKLYVRSAARGKGIGRTMMDVIKKTAARDECSVLWLVVNRHNALAISVYESMGFIRTDTRVKDIGNGFVMDDYVYELSL